MSPREPASGVVDGAGAIVPAPPPGTDVPLFAARVHEPDPEPARPDDEGLVRVVDTAEARMRHPSDLLAIVLAALGVVVVLLASVYAHGTTVGVTEDVRGFSQLLAQVLVIPVAVLQLLVTVFAPAAVLIELGIRRLGRQIIEAISAAALAFVLGALVAAAVIWWGSDSLVDGLSVGYGTAAALALPVYPAAVAALLTVAGPRTRRRTVAWSWNLLFFTFFVLIITNTVSLPGVFVALLVGRVAGYTVRYVSGVRSERAFDGDLVTAIRRAGFTPSVVVRVRDLSDDAERAVAETDPISDVAADGEVVAALHVDPVHRDGAEHLVSVTEDASIAPDLLPADRRDDPADTTSSDAAAIALSRAGDSRVYAMFTPYGVRRDVVVLDGDRVVVGFLTRLWRALRLRGVEGRNTINLRSVAERNALLSYAATAAGVRTPRLLGIGEAADSMVLVQEHSAGAVSLRDLPAERLTDEVLAEVWRQLRTAHSAGLAHRALTSDVLLVGESTASAPEVWITGWDQGDIASSELARRMDLTQMVALLALRVGAPRAVASAVEVLPDDDIAAIGPLLQPVALPRTTRDEIRRDKSLLKDLRSALVERLPEAVIEPEQIERFGTRRIVTLTLTIVVVVVVVTTFNFDQIASAVSEANPWWAVASFVLGLFTWLGAAFTLVAFAPVRLPMFRAIAKQAAASFVALAAPAGVGAAALDLRMLTRRGVTMSLSVATVAVIQLSQFVVTIAMLLLLMVTTGKGDGLVELPSTTVLLAIGGVALLVVATLLIPGVRVWVLRKIRPTLRQVWPALSAILGQPKRLAFGMLGNVIQALSYVLAFDAALQAFNVDLTLVDVSIIYLVGNTAGALVPTPGGIGTIELALTGGLTAAGVPAGVALSATVVFRVATYWARIPIGWVAMRYLQKVNDL
ncbi:uncharacterized protein (TIRG00374 family) [Sediminihabitans luteus]|uniref:Uncharacterized protein (TIRG00374 family) n=1 Tax=Sediminihabitans luteus TaxID=1138585 RepID=A0A2M9D0W8_9CELL|nr:lysylphosphatidylglycerol synthase transmembrane domain-containing protein [Sediminihabitans luteus]PJJ77777.1 uncharacterized protein (TIRG00374 family) [Sediminihabitans luteus]GII99865.1 hypothetical protein Slu03_22430 [Sediminihabitans luteus]